MFNLSLTTFLSERKNAVWIRVAPFAAYMILLALTPLAGQAFPTLDVRWLYPVKAVLVAGLLTLFWRRFSELSGPRMSLKEGLAALAGGIAVLIVWIGPDPHYLSIGYGEMDGGFDPRSAGGDINWWLVSCRLAGAALVVPLMEELFWRSLVMRWLDRADFLALDPRAVSFRAVAITSVVFGLEHHLWLAGIFAGVVYGELYRRFGKLWLPVMAHAVTNGLLGLWVLHLKQWFYW